MLLYLNLNDLGVTHMNDELSLATEIDRGSVERLVRQFYTKVLKDDLISRYFLIALGDDLKNDKWYEHLKILENFSLNSLTPVKNPKLSNTIASS